MRVQGRGTTAHPSPAFHTMLHTHLPPPQHALPIALASAGRRCARQRQRARAACGRAAAAGPHVHLPPQGGRGRGGAWQPAGGPSRPAAPCTCMQLRPIWACWVPHAAAQPAVNATCMYVLIPPDVIACRQVEYLLKDALRLEAEINAIGRPTATAARLGHTLPLGCVRLRAAAGYRVLAGLLPRGPAAVAALSVRSMKWRVWAGVCRMCPVP